MSSFRLSTAIALAAVPFLLPFSAAAGDGTFLDPRQRSLMNDPVPPRTAHDIHKVICPQGVYELVSWPRDSRLVLQFDTGSERVVNTVASTALGRLLGAGKLIGQFHFRCGHGPSLHVEYWGVRIENDGTRLQPVVHALQLAADGKLLREDDARDIEPAELWRFMQPLPRPPYTP